MGTLKKFWKYFLMFMALFLLIGFLTNYEMKENYRDIKDYKIKTISPEIKVDEFKTTRTEGHIKGNVTNNTGEYFENIFLKINLFDKDDIYLGSEYKELKYFHNNEVIKFEIEFKYRNIAKATIEITDTKQEVEKDLSFHSFLDLEKDEMKEIIPLGILFVIYPFLP